MATVSLGDMAQTFLLRHQNVTLKSHLQRLTSEMSSGQKADLSEAVSGDFKALASINHVLTNLLAYKSATTHAQLAAGALQDAFDVAQSRAIEAAPALSASGTIGGAANITATSQDTRQKLFSVVSALNVRVGDRYLLSGDATDQKPISGAQNILSDLSLAISGQTTAAGVISAINTWFDAPTGGGGYLDTAYRGSSVPLAPMAIGTNDQASMTITAQDSTLRQTLKGLAMGALVAEGALPGDITGQALLMKTAGEMLMSSNADMANLRAGLGTLEAQISTVATRNAAEATSLEIARNGIISADPFATANDLEAVKTQLETLYSVTAHLSRLTLADFLR